MKRSVLDLCRPGNGRTLHLLTIIPVGFKSHPTLQDCYLYATSYSIGSGALRHHLKGKGLIKVRTAPYRLGHNHRRIDQRQP